MDNAFWPYEWPGSYFIGQEEKDAVAKVLDAQSPYRFFGHDVQGYASKTEDFFKKRLQRKHAMMVNSGSSALLIAMLAADIGPGDEVLVPGYCWVACWSAVVRCGAIPKLVDIDDTFTLDPEDLKKKIGPKTKALLAVHMSGVCGHLDQVMSICKERGILVIEDCAQCNGASFQGKFLGGFGDIAIFSFQYNKNITAGEGGLIVCDRDDLAQRIFALHEQGYAKNKEGQVDWNQEVQLWGYCSHMSEVTAAIVYEQAQKLDHITGLMRQWNHRLYAGLSKIEGIQVRKVVDPAGDSGPFVLFTFDNAEKCAKAVQYTRDRGLKPGPMGAGNIRLVDWGLHVYYNNTALVNKRSNGSAGRPWLDPINAFHENISYQKGTLPYCDHLVETGVLLTVPPVLTEELCVRAIGLYEEAVAHF